MLTLTKTCFAIASNFCGLWSGLNWVPWVLGTSNCSTGLGEAYDYWVLGPLGKALRLRVHNVLSSGDQQGLLRHVHRKAEGTVAACLFCKQRLRTMSAKK